MRESGASQCPALRLCHTPIYTRRDCDHSLYINDRTKQVYACTRIPEEHPKSSYPVHNFSPAVVAVSENGYFSVGLRFCHSDRNGLRFLEGQIAFQIDLDPFWRHN